MRGRICGFRGPAVLAATFMAMPAVAAPVELPEGARIEKVDFERHVMGLLGRAGCNAGACHGSFQGKGGLYLSLFGYSPEKDFKALTADPKRSRVDTAHPARSLMLLKPTEEMPHGGKERFARDSWQYNVVKQWIADGAKWTAGSGAVGRMEILPNEYDFAKPGETRQLKVMIEFADGTREDMTAFSDFRVNDDFVAEVSRDGAVKGLRPGDTAVVVNYRGNVRTARVLVPRPAAADLAYPQVPEAGYIDRAVFAKLRKLNIVPSDLSGDAEFLRRVTIDTIGSLPTPEEVVAFAADANPDKRAAKIDELLAHPLHAALWATKFSDITGNNVDVLEQPQNLRPKRAKMWHDWFRTRLAANMPYDKLVHGVLCAVTREGGLDVDAWLEQDKALLKDAETGFRSDYAKRETLDLFWRRQNFTLEQMAEHTAAAFMGIRLECAQCHKHPFDRWTQNDYRAYANIFSQVKFGATPPLQAIINKQNAERKKETDAALAAFEKEIAPRRKEIEDKVDKQNADRRAAFDKENAGKTPEQVKDALAALDKENAARRKEALSALEKEVAKKKAGLNNNRNGYQLREVFVDSGGGNGGGKGNNKALANPDGKGGLKPRALGGPEIELKGDPREALFAWLRSPDNPYFARSFANRVWGHYFGIGIVEPVDNFSVANPASNDALLDALAKDFIAGGFDIRKLERTVLMSRTYQLSGKPNATNREDRNNFSRSYSRRMPAEAVVDVLNAALGVAEDFGADAPKGSRAIEVATNRVAGRDLAHVFRVFGRPLRTATCDCERAAEPALPQTLYLMIDDAVSAKIGNGRLKALLASGKADAAIVDDLYLAVLTRPPSDEEKQRVLAHVKGARDRRTGFADVVWALINTREFILNH